MVLILLLSLAIVIGLPLAFAIKSESWFRYLKFPLGIIFLLGLFGIWKIYNPSNEYYLSLFNRISGLTLPQDSKFISRKHTEYFVQGEYGSCFVVKITDETKKAMIVNSTELEKPVSKKCGSGSFSTYNRIGKNISDYPFMNWYLSENNELWAYYEKY